MGLLSTAINYYDPNKSEDSTRSKAMMDRANETVRLEIERLRKTADESLQQQQEAEKEKRIMECNLAFMTEKLSSLENVMFI